MTIKIDKLPDEIALAIQARARAEHKSVDDTVVEALARGLGMSASPKTSQSCIRDLSDIAGSGGIDDEMEALFWEHRQVNPEDWK
jgi:hypothetical protein